MNSASAMSERFMGAIVRKFVLSSFAGRAGRVTELLQFAKSRRGGELIGIVIWAIGISLAAALLTYHPNDSSAFFTSTNTVIANAIGYYGATIAWIFVGFFGFASLLFPGALLSLGWNRFSGKDLEYLHTKRELRPPKKHGLMPL